MTSARSVVTSPKTPEPKGYEGIKLEQISKNGEVGKTFMNKGLLEKLRRSIKYASLHTKMIWVNTLS